MTMAPETEDQFFERLTLSARNNSQTLKELSPRERRKFVKQTMEIADVVYAIWYEDDEGHALCIKGNQYVGRVAPLASITAIFVKSAADAIGMRNDWGDSRIVPTHGMPGGVM